MAPSTHQSKAPQEYSVANAVDNWKVDISCFWDTRNVATWHNDYPRLTLGQLNALKAEAAAEGRQYVPPRTTATPLWSSTGYSRDCVLTAPATETTETSAGSVGEEEETREDDTRASEQAVASSTTTNGSASDSAPFVFTAGSSTANVSNHKHIPLAKLHQRDRLSYRQRNARVATGGNPSTATGDGSGAEGGDGEMGDGAAAAAAAEGEDVFTE